MKSLSLVFCLFLMAASCDQQKPWDQEIAVSDSCTAYTNWSKAADLSEVPGTVINESDSSTNGWVYIQASDSRRYFACNLPLSVQKTGTRVLFNAVEFMPPPTVRLAGIPIKLTKLRTVK